MIFGKKRSQFLPGYSVYHGSTMQLYVLLFEYRQKNQPCLDFHIPSIILG